MVTLPKLMEPGVTPSVPLVELAEPLSAIAMDGSDAFEFIARLPVSVPALVGEKFIVMFALEPAAKEYGRDNPLTLKPVPVTVAAEIVRLWAPVLERVSTLLWLLPTAMLPKRRLPGALR